jgi:putative phosphoesterase
MNASRPVVVGLISDTHAPERCKELPEAIFEALAGVDLILHAGDVGELWVLDQLSKIAPIIAVHGNDETAEAKAALPYLQTVSVAGHRIVLSHANYPDLAEEMESRRDDRWEPKLSFRAALAKQHGATIMVYGHTHIPMQLEWEGVLLINPGAIASGSGFTKQLMRGVAKLHLELNAQPRVEHFDLRVPLQPYTPAFEYQRGFRHTHLPTYTSIIAPELEPMLEWLRAEVYPLAPQPLLKALHTVAHRCWSGEQDQITLADVAAEAQNNPNIPAAVISKLRESPVFAPYLS